MTERRGGRGGARRVSVWGASVLLGISKGAVMTRVRDGTLRSEKTEEQMVDVWLGDALDSDRNSVISRARAGASLRGTAGGREEVGGEVRLLREVGAGGGGRGG